MPNHWLRSLLKSRHLLPDALEAALREAGLTTEHLAKPGTLLPLSNEIAVFEALARHSSDPLLAIRLGQTHEARTGSILSYIIFSSPTVGEALEHMRTFSRLTRPRSRVTLLETDDGIEMRMDHPDPRVQVAVAHKEFVIAAVLQALRDASQQSFGPQRVYLSTPIGHRRGQIEEVLGCPVETGSGRTGIVLARSVLALPIVNCDRSLLEHLTEYGRILLSRQRPAPWTMQERVFNLVKCRLTGGVPRLADIAQALAVSERTLSRRLAEEETTYRVVVDSARSTMAQALLDDPSLSLSEISYLVGFADQGSFTHAFRRWTGQAPARARRVSRNAGGSRQTFGA